MSARNTHDGLMLGALLGALWVLFGCSHREQAKKDNYLILLDDATRWCRAVRRLASILKCVFNF